jgi:hypothetical protein
MKLTDLNPCCYNETVFSMDCPCGKCGTRIRIYTGPKIETSPGGRPVWKASGTFPDTLTLEPSILIHPWEFKPEEPPVNDKWCRGWHGWIRAGEVVNG